MNVEGVSVLANGVGVEVIGLGCGIVLAFLVAVAVIESLASWPIIGLRPRQTIRVWLAANAFSALGGLLVLRAFGGQFLFFRFLEDSDLIVIPLRSVWLRLGTYFVETIVIELLVWSIAQALRPELKTRNLFVAVLLGNLASYAATAPLLMIGFV